MAEKPKRKSKTKSQVADKKQSERFKGTARTIGIDESGKSFSVLVGKVLTPRRRH